jgi:hypothetical protein
VRPLMNDFRALGEYMEFIPQPETL